MSKLHLRCPKGRGHWDVVVTLPLRMSWLSTLCCCVERCPCGAPMEVVRDDAESMPAETRRG